MTLQHAGSSALAVMLSAMALGTAGCGQPRVAEVYPQVAEYDGRRIEEMTFENTDPFSADSLESLIETRATDCSLLFLPFCFPGTDWGLRVARLDMRTLGADLSRLGLLYRQNGYFGTRVVPEIEEVEDDGPIRIHLLVRRGDGIVLDSVVVEGTEGIADPDSLEAELPLQAGELLDLVELVASADTVLGSLRRAGHAYAEVLRNYAVDTIQDRATVWLLAVPGPRVEVDSVLVDGLEELARGDVTRQLTFSSGDLLRLQDLRESQRNLYDLELIRFASVAVADDTLQLTAEDSTTATVRVAISEGPEHVVEAGAGAGTVDCLGIRAEWSDRSVFGGGRKVSVTGSLSRIGLGEPVAWWQDGVCSQGKDTLIARDVDYRAALEFTQPYFLNPRNQVVTTLYAERQSEPELIQRTARGGRFVLTHRVRLREVLSGGLMAEYRFTEASRLLYCIELLVCGEEDYSRFQDGTWRTGVELGWVRDRGNQVVNPTDGYVLRSTATWSTPALGSAYDFLRGDVEAAIYRSVGSGVVVGASARFGSFLTEAGLGTTDFVPPEERFFAGGASSVRGFDRNRLGPGVYLVDDGAAQEADSVMVSDSLSVDFQPTGGASLAVLSAEARFPSPVLRDLLRLAVFVDAGTVGINRLWEGVEDWRVTPGVGARVQTPVGPLRVDLAYNFYPPPVARLYVNDLETGDDGEFTRLVRKADAFQPPEAPAWSWSRLRLHIAVGQAF
jgi:outer membrane protein insertion porin family